jgi:uncharacterized protein (DUF362 family)
MIGVPPGLRLGPQNFRAFLKALLAPEKGPKPAKGIPKNQFTKSGKSLVSIVKDKDTFSAVEKAVDLLGGIGKLKLRNKIVVVKPNVNSDDHFPGTTNPAVVAAVVRLLKNAGAEEVIVADQSNSFYLPTIKTMQKLGIKQAAEEEGAIVTSFEEYPWVKIEDPRMKYVKSVSVSKLIYEADYVVSIPVVKTHSLETFTMSLKNWVGIIHPQDRYKMHMHENIAQYVIPELGLCVHPDLVVMDGTVCMVAGGPFSGTEKKMDLVIASGDRIANDLVGLGIIKHFDIWPRVSEKKLWEQKQIQRAVELNLGATSPNQIQLGYSPKSDKNLSKLIQEINRYISET